MRAKIQNIDDLRSEIRRLRMRRLENENDLQLLSDKISEKFNVPVMIFNKISEFFGSLFGNDKDDAKKQENTDWVTNIFRVGIPVFLNKFIFPKSGFLLKSVVAMLSQSAAKNVNKDSITDIIDKVAVWLRSSKPRTRKEPVLADYGIPPDSETY
ncbi:MAG: hypothetical protein ACYCZO_00465 [Daejeonella sp.]